MATRSQENDFDRIKRWGKEFVFTEQVRGGTGLDDTDKVTTRTTRFNPPPGWPPAPAGWMPPPGWQPDTSWPEPPPGWQLWVDDRPAISPRTRNSLLAMAGGTALVLGSLMPWVSLASEGLYVKPGVKAASVVFGLLVVALGFALRAAPRPGRLVAGIATLGLSSLVGLMYAGFILVGLHGVQEPDLFGDMATVTWSPTIGLILATAGCGAAFIAAIRSLSHLDD